MSSRLGVALLHYPVLNRNRETVTTAVTNLDVHDIARSARTFGVQRFYVVTPIAEQQRLLEQLLGHWREGFGSHYNPDRCSALELVRVVSSFAEALEDFSSVTGQLVTPLLTGAGRKGGLTMASARERLQRESLLLTLGTGSGLVPELFEQGWPVLESLCGPSDYNHLSVRAAAAIMLDRLTEAG